MKLYGECTGREKDLLDSALRTNSPNYDLISQLNPFILRGDNLAIALLQNGISSDNSISLLNSSERCIKFAWEDAVVEGSCKICVEPKSGYLKE